MQRFHRTNKRGGLMLRASAKSFRFAPAQYPCVGVTDCLGSPKYVPSGYRLVEASVSLGSGDKRFFSSRELLMCWKVHRLAGLNVRVLDPGEVDCLGGSPILRDKERILDESGFDFARPGCIVALRSGLRRVRSVMRVVYAVSDVNRVALILASIVGHGLHLEEGFFIEKHPDSSVRFTVRILRRASCVSWITMNASKHLVSRYLRVLDPTWAL